jgi:hypothetical protein
MTYYQEKVLRVKENRRPVSHVQMEKVHQMGVLAYYQFYIK